MQSNQMESSVLERSPYPDNYEALIGFMNISPNFVNLVRVWFLILIGKVCMLVSAIFRACKIHIHQGNY
jgi:hypothetical protein